MKRGDTVGIVGAGAFGTGLGSVLARAGRRVVLWSRDTAIVDAITNTRSCPRLPDAPLPESLEATTDPRRLASEARFLVMAVSSTDVRDRATELGAFLDGSHIVVHAIGALAAPDNERVSEVMARGLPTLRIGALAGPALPGDLAAGEFASMVVASTFNEVVSETRRLLNVPPMLRVYGSKDLAGVELAAALAGAYTVALGLCDGLEMGPGPRAVLITRAVAEASRLGQASGAEARTFAGLAGLGNLLVRATDRTKAPKVRGTSVEIPALSADYQLGRRLAEGVLTADTARTEGARAALAGSQLAMKLRVRMPVLEGVAAVLAGLGNLLVRATDRTKAPKVRGTSVEIPALSADYQLGRRLAEGVLTADTARTEGARAALAGSQLAMKLRVRMPVLEGVAAVLAGKAEPRDVAKLIGDNVAVEE